jgi:hypothetical protein
MTLKIKFSDNIDPYLSNIVDYYLPLDPIETNVPSDPATPSASGDVDMVGETGSTPSPPHPLDSANRVILAKWVDLMYASHSVIGEDSFNYEDTQVTAHLVFLATQLNILLAHVVETKQTYQLQSLHHLIGWINSVEVRAS